MALRSLSLAFLAACATATPQTKPPGTQLSSTGAAELSGPWRTAQHVRELRATKDAQVALLSDDAFKDAVRERTRGLVKELGAAAEASVLVALGFVPPGTDVAKLIDAMLAEEVIGFYDPKAQILYMKRSATVAEQRATLVHELGHALQDQRFGYPTRGRSADERLAARALFEGDAVLIMVADALDTAKAKNPDDAVPLSVGAERMRLFFASQPPGAVLDVTGQNKDAKDAPILLRDTLLFPYVAGFELAARLYRSGGYAMLNEAYKTLPRSTEQVLHPEKYLAGEQPVHIPPATAPPGTKLVAKETLGELGLRALLSQCLSSYAAQQAAQGWGGDALTVAVRSDRRLAVAHASTWDSEANAIEFEHAMRQMIPCWAKRATGASGTPWIDAHAAVIRRGNDVAFVRGMDGEEAAKELDRLLALRREHHAATPPFGSMAFVPPPPLPETSVERGTVTGRHYEHPRFSLSSEIPRGFSASTSVKGIDLMIRTELGATGIFTASHADFTSENTDQFFDNVTLAFAAQLGRGVELETVRSGPLEVLDRQGEERVLSVVGTAIQIRAVVVPTCDRKWIYGFVLSSIGDADVTALNGWLASHREAGPPPACNEE